MQNMHSLKKMVQYKRVKVLILVILMCFGVITYGADVPDIKYFASKNTSVCISSGQTKSSATAWIYPFNYTITTGFYYLPVKEHTFNVNFEKVLDKSWKLKGWNLSSGGPMKPILDTRWEALSTVSIKQEFQHTHESSIHVENFPISFSVLAPESIQILLCEGWNPNDYSSYYINIGGIDNKRVEFGKFNNMEQFDEKNVHEYIKVETNILSALTWKTFHLNYQELSGSLELFYLQDDGSQITIVKNIDKKPLKPIYFMMRNKNGVGRLKFHENNYLFTNESNMVPFGPKLSNVHEEVCISLFTALCNDCFMRFHIHNATNITQSLFVSDRIKSDDKLGEMSWKEIRLVKKLLYEDLIQVFLETNVTNPYLTTSPFWAVDDVRVCTTDDVKVSVIESDSDSLDSGVTCQSLSNPKWRPPQNNMSSHKTISKLFDINTTQKEISFKFSRDIPTKDIYILKYEATAVANCISTNLGDRRFSKGYITTFENDITIHNLVPYTEYNVTILDPVNNKSVVYNFTTKGTDRPSQGEIPSNVKIIPQSDNIDLSWNFIPCASMFGNLSFVVNLQSTTQNISVIVPFHRHNRGIYNLNPFTNYTMSILPTRDDSPDLSSGEIKNALIYNFTTLPGIAPKVVNLEAYSIDKNSAKFRFKLPQDGKGVANYMKVRICPNLYDKRRPNCNTKIYALEKCKLWINMYCGEMDNLKLKEYVVLVSIKNENTNIYGEEASFNLYPRYKAPGAPTNISYKMINCGEELNCHLNVTWQHPFQQLSTITSFDITLEENIGNDFKLIKEVYIVHEYQPFYSHIVQFISYSTSYIITIKSKNNILTSSGTSITANTDHLGKFIDQSPHISDKTSSNITFSIAKLDERLQSYLLIIYVQNGNTKIPALLNDSLNITVSEHGVESLKDLLCQDYGETWIAYTLQVMDQAEYNVTVGDGKSSYSSELNDTVHNRVLSAGTYCFTFLITNRHQNQEHVVVYYEKNVQIEEPKKVVKSSSISFLMMIVVFSITAILFVTWIVYRYLKQRDFRLRRRNDGENIYMSLESLPGAVSNDTYDKLIH